MDEGDYFRLKSYFSQILEVCKSEKNRKELEEIRFEFEKDFENEKAEEYDSKILYLFKRDIKRRIEVCQNKWRNKLPLLKLFHTENIEDLKNLKYLIKFSKEDISDSEKLKILIDNTEKELASIEIEYKKTIIKSVWSILLFITGYLLGKFGDFLIFNF